MDEYSDYEYQDYEIDYFDVSNVTKINNDIYNEDGNYNESKEYIDEFYKQFYEGKKMFEFY